MEAGQNDMVDPVFLDIEAVLHLIENRPNPYHRRAEIAAYELCRREAVAAVASMGLKRIGDLDIDEQGGCP